jgi:hypothetical protein
MKVKWDFDVPKIWKKNIYIMFQTTNQIIIYKSPTISNITMENHRKSIKITRYFQWEIHELNGDICEYPEDPTSTSQSAGPSRREHITWRFSTSKVRSTSKHL